MRPAGGMLNRPDVPYSNKFRDDVALRMLHLSDVYMATLEHIEFYLKNHKRKICDDQLIHYDTRTSITSIYPKLA